MYIDTYIMESRKMVLVNPGTEKKWRCRRRDGLVVHSGQTEAGETDNVIDIYTRHAWNR